jgi:hypothetical protein
MDKYSEEYRHQCEVRELLKMRVLYGREWLRRYLMDKKVSGRVEKLSKDIWKQWTLGNRGDVEGLWLDE